MGKLFVQYYDSSALVYHCLTCDIQLALDSELESKDFRSGPFNAFLFQSCINVQRGPTEERQLTTGSYIVSDLFCLFCHSEVGWIYVKAFNPEQNYKVDKIILVQNKIYKTNEKQQTKQRFLQVANQSTSMPSQALNISVSDRGSSLQRVRQSYALDMHQPVRASARLRSSPSSGLIGLLIGRAGLRFSALDQNSAQSRNSQEPTAVNQNGEENTNNENEEEEESEELEYDENIEDDYVVQ
jgi:hypothetical protein